MLKLRGHPPLLLRRQSEESTFSRAFSDVVDKCVTYNSAERPSIDQLIQNSFLKVSDPCFGSACGPSSGWSHRGGVDGLRTQWSGITLKHLLFLFHCSYDEAPMTSPSFQTSSSRSCLWTTPSCQCPKVLSGLSCHYGYQT